MPADIIVRIGAAQDSSVDAVFSNLEKRSKRAFETTRRDAQRNEQMSGQQQVAMAQLTAQQQLAVAKWRAGQELKVERDRYRENSRLNRQLAAEQAKTERAMALQSAKISRERTKERISSINQEERAEAQYQARLLRMKLKGQTDANRIQRAAERERVKEAYKSEREIDRFATRTSHRATRFFFPRPEGALGYARRIGHDMLRGAGIDLSLSGGIARNVEASGAALKLSNQGWNPNEVAWDQRIKAKDVRAKSQEIGMKFGYSEESVTEGMQEYTNLTGDLKGAIELMPQLALLAKATGSELSDMGRSAADMGVQLEGIPDKGKVLMDVLNIAAMQGKTGALELFQLAPMMPRIVSMTRQFAGDRGTNMADLLASTQLIRRYGGTGTPSQATTAIAGAVAAVNAKGGAKFSKYGVKTANDKGQLLSLEDIVTASIVKSYEGGTFNRKMFFDMWNAQRGGKLAQGMLGVYNTAEAKKKGTGAEAIHGEYRKFTTGLDVTAQNKLAEEASSGTAAKAQRFQMAFDKMTQGMQDRLLPAMERLAPMALGATEGLQKLVVWGAGNPGAAISAALVASVGRAGFESAGRMFVERMITSVAAAGGMRAVLSSITGAGAVGTLALSLAVGAATFSLTSAIIHAADVSLQESKTERAKGYNETYQTFAKEYGEAKTPEEREAAVRRAKVRVGEIHEERGGLLNAVTQDEDMSAALKGIADFMKTARTGEEPWKPGDLAPAKGMQPASAQEIGTNVASAMRATPLQISGWDALVESLGKLQFASGGAGGPATFSQGP